MLPPVNKHLPQKPWSFTPVTSCFQSARYRLTPQESQPFPRPFPLAPFASPCTVDHSCSRLRNGYLLGIVPICSNIIPPGKSWYIMGKNRNFMRFPALIAGRYPAANGSIQRMCTRTKLPISTYIFLQKSQGKFHGPWSQAVGHLHVKALSHAAFSFGLRGQARLCSGTVLAQKNLIWEDWTSLEQRSWRYMSRNNIIKWVWDLKIRGVHPTRGIYSG